jgi:hypothetical protein
VPVIHLTRHSGKTRTSRTKGRVKLMFLSRDGHREQRTSVSLTRVLDIGTHVSARSRRESHSNQFLQIFQRKGRSWIGFGV